MSLNRYEQILFSYIETRPEELRFWRSRVEETARQAGQLDLATRTLSGLLWEYYEERSRHESPFRETAIYEGMNRVSLMSLAEYLLRIWAPPFRKKKRE